MADPTQFRVAGSCGMACHIMGRSGGQESGLESEIGIPFAGHPEWPTSTQSERHWQASLVSIAELVAGILHSNHNSRYLVN